jgi:DNA-directed RNA polymerase specialized sigma24 family protein
MCSRLRLAGSGGRRAAESANGLSFDSFFHEEAGPLFRRLCLVTGDRQEAEEVLQDAFLALFERWDRIQSLDDPVGYLYRTAFNRWKRLSRRAARQLRGLGRTVDRTAILRYQLSANSLSFKTIRVTGPPSSDCKATTLDSVAIYDSAPFVKVSPLPTPPS